MNEQNSTAEGNHIRMRSQALSTSASSRRTAAGLPKLALAVTLAMVGVVVPATSAMAADSAAVAFAAAFNAAAGGETVSLTEDVTIETADDLPLTVSSGESITLDLNGHALDVSTLSYAAIGVPSGTALTINDSSTPRTGTLVATSASNVSAGIGGHAGDAGDITIDSGDVTATGGFYSAGIGGGDEGAGGGVVINGGTVTATGGSSGAGIGGGTGGGAGTVTINDGTVVAHGFGGAGIGGGGGGAGGTVAINGGTVTATGSTGSGIGSGSRPFFNDPLVGGTLTIGSSAAVTAAGRDAQALGSHTDLGSVTNAGSLTLPDGASIDLKTGTLNNSGTVHNAGTIFGAGNIEGPGTVVNTGSIAYTVSIDGAQTITDHHYSLLFDPDGGNISWGTATPWDIVDGPTLQSVERSTADLPAATRSGYTFDGWHIDVDDTATLVTDATSLPGSSVDGTPVPLTVYAVWSAPCAADDFAAEFNGAGDGATVVLCADTTITASDNLPLAVASATAITLDLNGHTLDVTGSSDHAGIGVHDGAALTIADSSSPSSGQLIATGGDGAAGIGGDVADAGTIIIDGGTITANGGTYGAGIGGGAHDDGGTITINGGDVTATGEAACEREIYEACAGAGIGGAGDGGVGTITINGGIVAATGNGVSAGIGGGGSTGGSNGGTITINGGDVTATGGNAFASGAGIGAAGSHAAGPITITGGTVHATGGHGPSGDGAGAGIGSGSHVTYATDEITISGGDITAIGGADSIGAAGIGGGSCSAGPVIAISGSSTVVTATGTTAGAGIGAGGCSPDYFADGGAVTIDTGATVTALSESGNAIGGSDDGAFGSLNNAGMLTLAGPLTIPTDATVTNDGTLVVSTSIVNAGTITGTGTIGGVGTVDNAGAIWHTQLIDGELTVQDHHYQLSFDTAGGEADWAGASPWDIVDGPTLSDVGRTTADLPEATRPGYAFTGWFLDTGDAQTLVTDTTTLPGSSTDGIPVALTLVAGWEASAPAHVIIAGGDDQTTDAGSVFSTPLAVSVVSVEGEPVLPGTEVTFTVTQGDASFADQTSATAATDELGIAFAPELTAGSTSGVVTVEATVDGVTSPAVFTETVVEVLTVTTTGLPDAEVGIGYEQALAATGASDEVYAWTLADGSLPDGLSLSTDGAISGTPTSAGTFSFTVAVNDSATAELTIVVAPAPVDPEEPIDPEDPTGPEDPTETDPPAETGDLAVTGGVGDLLSASAAAVMLLLAGGLALMMAARSRRIRHDW